MTRRMLALGIAAAALVLLGGSWLRERRPPAQSNPVVHGSSGSSSAVEPEAVLWVQVASQDTGAPLADVDLAVAPAGTRGHGGARVSALEGAAGRIPRTGADGLARFRLASGAYALQLSWGAGARGRRTVEVSALAPGEERWLEVELPTAPDLPFRGRVLDARGGEPLAGAEVLLFEGDLWSIDWPIYRPARVVTELARTESDGAGCFEVRGCSWKPELVRVRVAGFVPGFAPLVPGHERAGQELCFDLRPSASLEVVLEQDGAPAAGLSVSLLAESVALRSGVSDAGGRCLLEELPAGVPLRLWIALRGAGADPPGRRSVGRAVPELLPGEKRRERLRLERDEQGLRVEAGPR